MKKVLVPIPSNDFDPTETAVPWRVLSDAGVSCTFATPQGYRGQCDLKMLTGNGLGILAPFLAADQNGRASYLAMESSSEFQSPIRWSEADAAKFDGLILPGGHAPGMREYLESKQLQSLVRSFFVLKKCVGAICHGVILVGRSSREDGKSLLHGRKTTALLGAQELSAWVLTRAWLKDYYRTYSRTVESEVRSYLASPGDFLRGPLPLRRDSSQNKAAGFAVVDNTYVSARWPGDAHTFATSFHQVLTADPR